MMCLKNFRSKREWPGRFEKEKNIKHYFCKGFPYLGKTLLTIVNDCGLVIFPAGKSILNCFTNVFMSSSVNLLFCKKAFKSNLFNVVSHQFAGCKHLLRSFFLLLLPLRCPPCPLFRVIKVFFYQDCVNKVP